LRLAAIENKPWRYSTGPKSPEGKARCAENGRRLRRDVLSNPEIRAEIAQANAMIAELIDLRSQAFRSDHSDAGGPRTVNQPADETPDETRKPVDLAVGPGPIPR
jgi:hypothetical protein